MALEIRNFFFGFFIFCLSLSSAQAQQNFTQKLKVESRNMGHWLNVDMDPEDEDKVNAFTKMLAAEKQTDVLLLQETSPHLRPLLEQTLGQKYLIITPTQLAARKSCEDVAIIIRRTIDGQPVRLIESHFEKDFSIPQEGGTLDKSPCSHYGLISAKVEIGGRPYRFMSLHLPSNTAHRSDLEGLGRRGKREQLLKRLHELALKHVLSGETVMLGGDFNVRPKEKSHDKDKVALYHLRCAANATDCNREPTVAFSQYDHILAFAPPSLLVTPDHSTFYAAEPSKNQEIRWTDHNRLRAAFRVTAAQPNADTPEPLSQKAKSASSH